MSRNQDSFGLVEPSLEFLEFLGFGEPLNHLYVFRTQAGLLINRKIVCNMSQIKATKIKQNQSGITDPLYSIFEQHLYNFQDSNIDRKTFISHVVQDYLTHIRKMKIAVPKHYEAHIVEELSVQVNAMLIKKIYGCFSIDEYRQKTHAPSRPARENVKLRSSRNRAGSNR